MHLLKVYRLCLANLPCLALVAAMLVIPAVTQAEDQEIGEYTVHYIAVNSTFLDPDIAAQYNIVRSARRGFINVAVLHNNADGTTSPVTALVTGGKRNLLQQSSELLFQEVKEGEAIYYLAQFEFSNAENLRFTVQVQPEQAGKTYPIEWSTALYAD